MIPAPIASEAVTGNRAHSWLTTLTCWVYEMIWPVKTSFMIVR